MTLITIEDVKNCKDLFESVNLSKVYIFGSVSRNENDENSDLDLIFDFDIEHISVLKMYGLKSKLEDRLKCDVDILTMSQINESLTHNQQSLEYRIGSHANRDKILIYDKNT